MSALPQFPPGSFITTPAAQASKERALVLFIILILLFFNIEKEDENEENCDLGFFFDLIVLIILGVAAFANQGMPQTFTPSPPS
jgi:hypothetical protein